LRQSGFELRVLVLESADLAIAGADGVAGFADSVAPVASVREVEPMGFLGGQSWYLVAWCRLREEVRTFRMDRIRSAEPLDEALPPRDFDLNNAARGYPLEMIDPFGNSDRTVSQRC
jgi:hypothetical protein